MLASSLLPFNNGLVKKGNTDHQLQTTVNGITDYTGRLPGTAQSELVELYSNFFNPEDGESMFL
jgi:hypothetical protein